MLRDREGSERSPDNLVRPSSSDRHLHAAQAQHPLAQSYQQVTIPLFELN